MTFGGRGRPRLSNEEKVARARARGSVQLRQHIDTIDTEPPKRPKCPPRPDVHYTPDIPVDFDDLIEQNWDSDVDEAVAAVPRSLSKRESERWSWNESDEWAIAQGCRFDLRRAMHFAYVCRNYLCLWEGRWAGEPFLLRTWQPETLLRIFGWVRPHKSLGWVRRFTKASVWVPKKHGKSPVGAAVAIYLWKYDGIWLKNDSIPKNEAGQHVYCIASNGKQAGIVHRHATNMVQNSPLLKHEYLLGELKYNATTKTLHDQKTLSTLEILTGDSGASMKAAEGLNAGGIICDEAHVVDERTVETTTDAGASRDQFLWFQISTYGAGSGGYGRKDLEYGRDVADGRIKDDAYFFRTYEAPQDASDADCGREEIWAEANPNLGYTVNELQFQQAYDRSKDDPVKFAGFKQRRLNIWQASVNPLLNQTLWAQAASEITYESLKGVGGGAGLDLAASEDWAALAVSWQTDTLNVWVRFWTTEKWVDEHAHQHDFLKWWNQGWLKMHDGVELDFAEIEDECKEIIRYTGVSACGYDKMFAVQMAQSLKKRCRIEIYPFGQGIEQYARGVAEVKNALRNGTLRHPNNPALNWQAEHVQGKSRGELTKPVKPDEDDQSWKKIDGIQAMCMAVDVRHHETLKAKPWVGVI